MPELLRELAERDPVTYERIDRQNPRRVVRAVEVVRLTGKPFSAQRAEWQPSTLNPQPSTCSIGLTRSAADLLQRIEARVDSMFRRGWVAETEHLRGERSLAATIELVKTRTRQFAKRQMTWFRRQLQLTWVNLEPQGDADAAAKAIAEL